MTETKLRTPTIGIIVILVVLAVIVFVVVPAWRTNNARNHVVAALEAADAAKVVVSEAAMTGGSLATLTADTVDYQWAANGNEYAANVVIGDGGSITLTTTKTGVSPNPVLVLTPAMAATGIEWTCTATVGDAAVVPDKCEVAAPATATSS